jgi:hypothetical protein
MPFARDALRQSAAACAATGKGELKGRGRLISERE